MNRADFARAKELFLTVCSLPESERPRFLDRECGDDSELRREVEALLLFHVDDDKPSSDEYDASDSEGTRRFQTGEILDERYRIVTHLGRGGVGDVYRAHDLVLDEEVALKFLSRPENSSLGVLQNEVRLARKVSHPNVCRVFDMGILEGDQFLSMEYVEGEDLASLLRRIGRLPQDKLAELAQQLCAGLAAAHARGVIHRDLKPANVMIDHGGNVRITDFGIATSSEGATGVERFGTIAYMAPEQLRGEPATVQSDLYSLGLVLYEAATGRTAFEASTPAEYVELHQTQKPEAPSRLVDSCDPAIEATVLKCLEKDPGQRPQSALAVAATIPGSDPLQIARDAGVTPSPEVVAAATGGPEGRSTIGIIVASVVLVLALIGVFTLSDQIYCAAEPSEIKAPAVLTERASEVLRDLGYPEPVDRAWGFEPCCTRLTGEAAHRFWYREAQSWLVPDSARRVASGNMKVVPADPSPIDPGMVEVRLDSAGRLMRLQAVPLEGPPDAEPPVGESSEQWNAVLQAAGFDLAALEEALPMLSSEGAVDRVAAWIAPDPRGLEETIHIDAAAFGGQVVFFDASPDKEAPQDRTSPDVPAEAAGLVSAVGFVTLVIVLVALVGAWINVKRGRGDPMGARKLALVVVVARMGLWLLTADHFSEVGIEMMSFELAFGGALAEAVLVWVVYLALEPWARRWWPQALVAWNRIQRGQTNHPVIGRSLLIGAAAGAVWALAVRFDLILARSWDLELGPFVDGTFPLATAFSPLLAIGRLVEIGIRCVYWGLAALFVLAVLSALVRVRWIAVILTAVGFGAMEALQGSHPMVSVWMLGLLVGGTGTWLMVRFGLLAYATAYFCYVTLLVVPVTLATDAWFAGTGLFGLLVVAALGGLGAWLAWGGKRART